MVQNAKSATKWFSTHHALASNQGGNVFHGTTTLTKTDADPLVPGLIELTYYSNTLTPSFAFELIVLTSLITLFRDKPNDAGISRKHLLKASLENCGVYRYEFILNIFTQVLDQLLESTINELLNRELIKGIDTKEMTESDVQTSKVRQFRAIKQSSRKAGTFHQSKHSSRTKICL
ncbi:uncharacterized protein LOC129916010 [Episyrphus balteatus]|uniref:uncharacterized protein LOC129916010 n=1 Tax=Episyrphus balteatus TaxID=286459 RepID=UPI002485FB4B|nr:uncharacterized protein LOC129916010 [Episyrphus balteatus]